MKKPYIRLLLFLVLMLALVAGLSYLSLDHVSKSKDEQEQNNKKMDVALVNEDDGATFNQNKLDFGDAFVKSMDKNNDHKWYVVSRGVAESGLKRGTYDMMMVIPNDFSQKALSINSESPEQVVLDYKINASDNEKVQAQAEETASSILNDFNRRIIDVYFASVIGNLQDAQDDVGELVNKEAEHTYTYNNAIHNPLSNYTDRFEAVKDNTATSKDRFSGLEDVLGSFEDSLTDRVDSSQDYQSSIDDAEETTKTASELRLDFMDQLNNYNNGLSGGDVDKQLQNLQDANDYINSQFQTAGDDADDRMESIATDTENLKKRLDVALKTVEEAHDDLEGALDKNGKVNKEVRNRLEAIVSDAFGDEDNELKDLFEAQDKTSREKIEDQISKLPYMGKSKNEIEEFKGSIKESDLSDEMKREILNVIRVTEKYKEEFKPDVEPKNSAIYNLKNHMNEKGITMTDKVEIPANKSKNEFQKFNLKHIPEGFTIEQLTLDIPGHMENKTYRDVEEDEPFNIPVNPKEGEFKVELKLKLEKKYVDNNLQSDFFKSRTWNWALDQSDIDGKLDDGDHDKHASIQYPDTSLVASATTTNNNEESKDHDGDKVESGKDDIENSNTDSGDENEDKETDDDSVENNDGDSDDEGNESDESDDPEKSDENNSENKNVEVKANERTNNGGEKDPIEIENNKVLRKVTEPIVDESTNALMNNVENTIAQYQKLLSSYESYFGFNLTDKSFFIEENDKLKDMASDDSLYYLFNEKDVNGLLTDYVLREITSSVTEEIREPLDQLEKQMDEYRDFIQETDQNAASLVEKVADTREETRNLNDSLEETLNNITEWREKSQDLVDSQTDIQQKNDEEQTAVMSLGSEFQPLLSQSQSLAERASNNLDSADNVYQTFDRIDEQADSIQQSGTDLVQQAEDLSVNMTDKVVNDQEFADNFSDVMANSRIGDRQNEDLYDFLSSPVDTKNKGMIVKGDTFTPYFLVLIGFIVSLFTAYVILTMNQRRMAGDQFETERSLMGSNALITGITACIGIVEGLVIGLLSAYYLGISEGNLVMWTGLMILMMLSMLLVSTYLLRQLKMIGMFILLAVLSMYLFLTKALGSGFAGSDALRAYSPLQYLETMITRATGGSDYTFIMFGLIALIVLAALANLLVLHRTDGNVAKDDEDVAEA